jgi:uncharacterized phiE125 gp8 family phage protein
MNRFLVTPPALEPLTLAEAKRWLRVDHPEDDALIGALIKGARERVEARIGRALISQGWRVTLDRWPVDGAVQLPIGPALAVTAVRVVDQAGVFQPLAPASWRLDARLEPPMLFVPSPLHPAPARPRGGIEIDVTAGYGPAPADLPEALRQAIRLILGHAFEHRGVSLPPPLPAEALALIQPYRAIGLGASPGRAS